jgi:hypothetical protein
MVRRNLPRKETLRAITPAGMDESPLLCVDKRQAKRLMKPLMVEKKRGRKFQIYYIPYRIGRKLFGIYISLNGAQPNSASKSLL